MSTKIICSKHNHDFMDKLRFNIFKHIISTTSVVSGKVESKISYYETLFNLN